MDGDRKYKQHGYMESGGNNGGAGGGGGTTKPAAKPHDGPRLPQMMRTVAAARCWNCSTPLSEQVDFSGACPKCRAALHCCRQCSYFEPSTRFQCLKPVPARVAHKDEHNDCAVFQPTVTVARDSGAFPGAQPSAPRSAAPAPGPKSPSDARAAFDSLFKK